MGEKIAAFLYMSTIQMESNPTKFELVIGEHGRLAKMLAYGKEPSYQEVDLLTSIICEFDFPDMKERQFLRSLLLFWNCRSDLKPLD